MRKGGLLLLTIPCCLSASNFRKLLTRAEPLVVPDGNHFSCYASNGGYVCDYDLHDYTSSRFSVRCPTSTFDPVACSCALAVRKGGAYRDCRVCILMESDTPDNFDLRYDCTNEFTGPYSTYDSTETEPPSLQPSLAPTTSPTAIPTTEPSLQPSIQPSQQPSAVPSERPTGNISSNDDPSLYPVPAGRDDDFMGEDSVGDDGFFEEDSVNNSPSPEPAEEDDSFGEDSVPDPTLEPVILTLLNSRTEPPTPSPAGWGSWTRIYIRGGD